MVKLVGTSLAAGALGLLQVWLTAAVISRRREKKVSLGDGGDKDLERRIRGHGNFIETAPMGLILMGLAESQVGAGFRWTTWGLGAMLVVGRCLHGYTFLLPGQWMFGRVGGMMLTLTSLVGLAATNVIVGAQSVL
eukprot:CAMPEP_0118967364 /NCGR_PEP_ID=MMETSP1173-20130426/4757_1 /TAXON_ID=1034831 /ORGANISM="Rhizochromulina marina cf, Strain CCMP1243" /LENGTH=135 /DNA_ID=CAMNT_0006916319 /DNA_START=21 /DNA_END=428 /DNA_ORIENTATION=-